MEELDDEIEYDGTPCPSCGCDHTWRRECYACHGEGYHELYEEDPLWYDRDDTETCGECRGVGWLHWCRKCGYDFTLRRRIGEAANARIQRTADGGTPADGPLE